MFGKKYNIAVFGADGMLGYDVVQYLTDMQYRKCSCIGIVRPLGSNYDIRNYDTMFEFFSEYKLGFVKYDIVVNCAAMTDVTKIENDKCYRDNAYSVNVIGPRVLAEVCKKHRIKLIQISTDYVYSQKSPLLWTYPSPSGTYNEIHAFHSNNAYEFPVNVYGMQKLEAELAIQQILPKHQYAILRTSWLYGMHNCKSFVHKFLKNFYLWKKEHDAGIAAAEKFSLPDDQMSVPTRTTELARMIYNTIDGKLCGVLPACGFSQADLSAEDYAPTWFRFAQQILRAYDSACIPLLAPTMSSDPSRPKFSRLFNGSPKDIKRLFRSEYPASWPQQLTWFINTNRNELTEWLQSQGCFDSEPEKEKTT